MPIIKEASTSCRGAKHIEQGWTWFYPSEGGLVMLAIGFLELGIV
jgi:hypothetical protein